MTIFGIAFLIAHIGYAIAYDYVDTVRKLCPEYQVCSKPHRNNQNSKRDVSDDVQGLLTTTTRMASRPGGTSSDISVSSISTNSPSRNPTTSSTTDKASITSFNVSNMTLATITEATDNEITSFKTNSNGMAKAYFDTSDLIPCCHPCSCDSDCQQSNTCCPGAEQLSKPESNPKTDNSSRKGSMAPADCLRPTFDNYNKIQSDDLPWYMVISRCPDDFTDELIIIRCTRNRNRNFIRNDLDFEDAVMVSDSDDTDTIFRNQHCAACNGVINVTRWTMKVVGDCRPTAYENIRLTANSANFYILYNCPIVFEPHPSVTLTARAACKTNLVKTCNVTGQWDAFDSEIENACDSYDVPYLDPYVPNTNQSRYTQYKNIYCFLCNQPAGVSRPDVCSRRQLGLTTKTYPDHTKTAVLNTTVFINRTASDDTCSNPRRERDPILNRCMLFHCGVDRYGQNNKCLRLSKQTYGVVLQTHLMLKPTANITCSRNISPLSSGDQNKFHNWLMQMIGVTACNVSDMAVKVYWQENHITETDILKAIVIVADITTNVKCSLEDIVDALLLKSMHDGSSFPASIDGSYIDIEENIDLSATITEAGWKAPEMDNNEIAIVQMKRGSSLKMNLTSRFYCPHYILKYSQYCQYSEFVGQPCPAIESLSGYKLLPRFSLISTTTGSYSVVVCKDVVEAYRSSLSQVPQTTIAFEKRINPTKRINSTVPTNESNTADLSNRSSTPAVSVTEMDSPKLNLSDIDSSNVDWFNFDSSNSEPSNTDDPGGFGQSTTPVWDVSRGLRREMSLAILTICSIFANRWTLFR